MTELQSKTFNYLRFPLIIGVVLIHSYSSNLTFQGESIGINTNVIADIIRDLGSQVLARVSVPLFFIMSRFLFFFNCKKFDIQKYKEKILSRIKTLLVPFFFWNFSVILLYYIAQSIPLLSKLFSGNNKLIKEYSAFDLLDSIIGVYGMPINYPFWFIKDLFFICLISPILFLLVKKFKIKSIIFLFFLWILEINFVKFPNIASIFFFSLGAYFSINDVDLLKCFKCFFFPSILIYPILCMTDLMTKNSKYSNYIHKFGVLLGIFFFINVVSYLIDKGDLKENKFLSEASFFIFAMHEPYLTLTRKILFKLIKPTSDLVIILLYIICPLIIIGISLFIYYLLRKYIPKILILMTGRDVVSTNDVGIRS